MRALILLLAACSHAAPGPAGTSNFSLITLPPQSDVTCYFDDMPTPPEALVQVEAVGLDRVIVHRREYEDLLSWLADFRMHVSQIKECMQRMGVHTW